MVDPFRPPPEPWLAGNRGLEYATAPGTLVRAIGPGRVAFAGPVAGRLVVTVNHPDGLRSSYTWLAAINVAEGDRVDGGDPIGVAGTGLHLGVRRGDTYIDPAGLWGTVVGGGRVVLVPDAGVAGPETGSIGGPGPPGPSGRSGPAGHWPGAGHEGRGAVAASVARAAEAARHLLGAVLTGSFLGAGGTGR